MPRAMGRRTVRGTFFRVATSREKGFRSPKRVMRGHREAGKRAPDVGTIVGTRDPRRPIIVLFRPPMAAS